MKFILTLAAAMIVNSPSAQAAPVTPTAADVVAAKQAANAAERTVVKFHRAGGVSYRSDPIGARIAAAKPVRSVKPKPATTTEQQQKFAAAFNSKDMAKFARP